MVPALPPGFPAQAEASTADPAAGLLDRAALLTIARRAGCLTGSATPPAVAPGDPRPAVTEAAAQRLDRILAGDPATGGGAGGGSELLTEWLSAVVTRGLRPPAQFLPALLQKARQATADDAGLRGLIAVAGGPRGLWLAGLNPAWAGLLTEPAVAPPYPPPVNPLASYLSPPAGPPPEGAQPGRPAAYLPAEQLAEVLAAAMGAITRAPLGAHRAIRLAGLWADPALGAPGALADFPPEAPNVLHNMLAVLRFRYEMLKELDDGHPDR